MNALPRPTQTIAVLESHINLAIDAAQRLESHIAELEAELRDGPNDYREGTVTIRLTAARTELAVEITRAANALRTVGMLREKAGMESHVLVRVMRECGE